MEVRLLQHDKFIDVFHHVILADIPWSQGAMRGTYADTKIDMFIAGMKEPDESVKKMGNHDFNGHFRSLNKAYAREYPNKNMGLYHSVAPL